MDFVVAFNNNGVGLMFSSDFIPKGNSKSNFTSNWPKLSDIKVYKFIRGSIKIY